MVENMEETLYRMSAGLRAQTERLEWQRSKAVLQLDRLDKELDKLSLDSRDVDIQTRRLQEEEERLRGTLLQSQQTVRTSLKEEALMDEKLTRLVKELDEQKVKTTDRKNRMDKHLEIYRNTWKKRYPNFESDARTESNARIPSERPELLEKKADEKKSKSEKDRLNQFVVKLATLVVQNQKLKNTRDSLITQMDKLTLQKSGREAARKKDRNEVVTTKIAPAAQQLAQDTNCQPRHTSYRPGPLRPATFQPGPFLPSRSIAAAQAPAVLDTPIERAQTDRAVQTDTLENTAEKADQIGSVVCTTNEQPENAVNSLVSGPEKAQTDNTPVPNSPAESGLSPVCPTVTAESSPDSFSSVEHSKMLASLTETPDYVPCRRMMFQRVADAQISPASGVYELGPGLAPVSQLPSQHSSQSEPYNTCSDAKASAEIAETSDVVMESSIGGREHQPEPEAEPEQEITEKEPVAAESMAEGQPMDAENSELGYEAWTQRYGNSEEEEMQEEYCSYFQHERVDDICSPGTSGFSAKRQQPLSPGMEWQVDRSVPGSKPDLNKSGGCSEQDSNHGFQFSFGGAQPTGDKNPFAFFGDGDDRQESGFGFGSRTTQPSGNDANDNPFSFFGEADDRQATGVGTAQSDPKQSSFFNF